MVVRKLGQNIIGSGIKASLKPIINKGPKWMAFKDNMGTWPQVETADFSNSYANISSTFKYLGDSFAQAQQEKTERANYMVRPIIHEASRILSLPDEEKNTIRKELKDVHEDYKETKKQIQRVNQAAEFIQKAVGSQLKEVLNYTIEPKTIDKFCKMLRTSTRIATQLTPPLRALNNLSLAYDAAKVLYPEHTKEIENYIMGALESCRDHMQQSTMIKNFKEKINECKTQSAMDLKPPSTINEYKKTP